MDRLVEYRNSIETLFAKILDEERANLETAAQKIALSLRDENNLLHIFGTGGHSMMAAEEIFHRAGGLVQVDPIFFGGLSVMNGVLKARAERVEGIAQVAMRSHTFRAGEVMLIVSHVGVNAVTIDAALAAKEKGLYIVGIDARDICKALPPGHPVRHSSNKNLYELADVCIDSKIPYGDAVISIPGAMQNIASVSNILMFYILHMLEIRIAEIMLENGDDPLIWRSGNIDGGDEHNDYYHDKYKGIIKGL